MVLRLFLWVLEVARIRRLGSVGEVSEPAGELCLADFLQIWVVRISTHPQVPAQIPDPIVSTQRLPMREDRILSTQRLPVREDRILSIQRYVARAEMNLST